MYHLEVTYKGFDQAKDRRIRTVVGKSKWDGQGLSLMGPSKGTRDIGFTFATKKGAKGGARRVKRVFPDVKTRIAKLEED